MQAHCHALHMLVLPYFQLWTQKCCAEWLAHQVHWNHE